MVRTIAAFVAVLLTACSGGSDKGTTSIGEGPGSGGSVSGTGAGTGSGNGTGTGTGSGTTSGGMTSSSTTGSGPVCGGVGPPIDTFLKSYSMDLCEWVFSCQADANYYYNLCTSYSAPGFGSLAAAVDAGRLSYCPSSAQTCLSGFTDAPCFGTPPQDLTACLESVRSLVVPGNPCYSTADCSGSFCQSDAGCAGTCVVWGEKGDACSDALPCNPSEGLGCINSKCVAPREINSPCGPNLPPCDATVGLACIAGSCLAPPEQLMKPCEFGLGQCAAGSYCFQKAGAASGKCLDEVAPNGICGEDTDHLRNAFSSTDFECQDGFTSVQCIGAGTLLDGGISSGKCESASDDGNFCPAPPAGIDDTKPFGNGCLYGLDCLAPFGVGTCDRPAAPGKSCYPLPFRCDPTKGFCSFDEDAGSVDGGGICLDALRNGAACTASDQCGAFNVCSDAGICELPTGPVCSPAF